MVGRVLGGAGPANRVGLTGRVVLTDRTLAVHALARTARVVSDLHRAELQGALDRGTAWLVERVENGSWSEASPIGFYFAKLWYYEKIYPLAFTVAALRFSAGSRRLASSASSETRRLPYSVSVSDARSTARR